MMTFMRIMGLTTLMAGIVTGIGASFQIDTRDNPTNPHKGLYMLLRETAGFCFGFSEAF